LLVVPRKKKLLMPLHLPLKLLLQLLKLLQLLLLKLLLQPLLLLMPLLQPLTLLLPQPLLLLMPLLQPLQLLLLSNSCVEFKKESLSSPFLLPKNLGNKNKKAPKGLFYLCRLFLLIFLTIDITTIAISIIGRVSTIILGSFLHIDFIQYYTNQRCFNGR
jgi:hypothetical protein